MKLSKEQEHEAKALMSPMRLKQIKAQALDERVNVYGQLTVLELDIVKTANTLYGPYWVRQCSCGKIKTVFGRNLRSGNSASCGTCNGRFSIAHTRKITLHRGTYEVI